MYIYIYICVCVHAIRVHTMYTYIHTYPSTYLPNHLPYFGSHLATSADTAWQVSRASENHKLTNDSEGGSRRETQPMAGRSEKERFTVARRTQ